MAKKVRERKGTFAAARLSVALAYVLPRSRKQYITYGLFACLALILFVFFNFFAQHRSFLSNGPLASAHANFSQNCAACHEPGLGVAEMKCTDCHERFGDGPGVFSFETHYLYRSTDYNQVAIVPEEKPCASCHMEHRGRTANLKAVGNHRCSDCHTFATLNEHPNWASAAHGDKESAALKFPHIIHARELMEKQGLKKPEQTCLFCHNPEPDGKNFKPLSFDDHCDACHLNNTSKTPPLPIREGDGVGVESLETLAAHGGPGSHWSQYANPKEYKKRGRNLSKGPLHHADPWVMENLRMIRQHLYQNAGLSDLLRTTSDVLPRHTTALYQEAIATLEHYALGLRSRPEPAIQADLARIGKILDELRARLRNPYAPLDETRFLLDLEPRQDLNETEAVLWQELAQDLTEPCLQCHKLEAATIVRVQADQRSQYRAEFNHRAHILQRGCLDCHSAIPFGSEAESNDQDSAEILNLPSINTCRECHGAQGVSEDCITCHAFHPDMQRRGHLTFKMD